MPVDVSRANRSRLAVLDAASTLRDCGSCATSGVGCRPSHAAEARGIMRFRSGSLHENWYVAAL